MSSAAILRGHLAQVLEPQLVRAPIYTYSSYQAVLKMSEVKAKDEKQTVATEIREPAEEDMRADVKQYSVSIKSVLPDLLWWLLAQGFVWFSHQRPRQKSGHVSWHCTFEDSRSVIHIL